MGSVPSTLDGTEKIMKVTKLLAEESAIDSWRFHYKEDNTNINATLQTKPQCSRKPHFREMLFKFSESIISTLHDSTVSTQLQNHLIKQIKKKASSQNMALVQQSGLKHLGLPDASAATVP